MAYTVKAVSDLSGVTVRTLHHYDEIGLLRPASVTPAGYRIYTDKELERLQQILFLRELGFSLEEIKSVLDSRSFDRKRALETQRELLLEQTSRLDAMIRSIDRTLDAMERGIDMDKKAMFEGFDDSAIREHAEKHKEEARDMYGKEAVDAAYARTAKYSKEDWAAIQAEEAEILNAVAARMDKGPADPVVQEKMAQKFRLINDRYYTCTPEIFRGLGTLYVNDERFQVNYERVKPGLAEFMRDAMAVYADSLEKKR